MSSFDLEDMWKKNAEEFAQSIKLQWDSPTNDGKFLLLVEWENDKVCYFKLFNPQKVEIRSTMGCNKMKRIFDLIQQYDIPNFAIQDSDFARVCDNVPTNDNFFLTDYHDHEMMCLANEDVMKGIFLNLALEIDRNIVQEIFDDLKVLSYFKWYNYNYHLNFKFKGYSPRGKTKADLHSFCAIFDIVKSHSSNCCPLVTSDDFYNFVALHPDPNVYEITNGHDFLIMLSQAIENKYKKPKLQEEILRTLLYANFTIDKFVKTNLYIAIYSWAGDNAKELFVA